MYYENVIVIVKDYCQVSLKEIYEFLQKKEGEKGWGKREKQHRREAGRDNEFRRNDVTMSCHMATTTGIITEELPTDGKILDKSCIRTGILTV